MIFSLKKAMEYGPKSQEVQHILEQIFNYYGIVSNKSTFTLVYCIIDKQLNIAGLPSRFVIY